MGSVRRPLVELDWVQNRRPEAMFSIEVMDLALLPRGPTELMEGHLFHSRP